MADVEEPLVGGRSTQGVVRIGDTVRRPAGPWTETVQAFLSYIRAHGFREAPEPRGLDERGREVLSFIPGDVLATPQDPSDPLVLVPYPEPWRSDEALAAAGRLIRQLHEAPGPELECCGTDNRLRRRFRGRHHRFPQKPTPVHRGDTRRRAR